MTIGPSGLVREAVPAAFDTSADKYDWLVNASPGYHTHLRLSARRMRIPNGGRGLRLLDAGCGTGASTAALLSAAPHAEILAFDASAEMLDRAKEKRWPSTVKFAHTTLDDLDAADGTRPFDGILAAYLVRNLANVDDGLRRLHDLLAPGATLAVHEYSVQDSLRARIVWHVLCRSVIIPLGTVVSGDSVLYRHLCRSVTTFPGVREFENRLRQAGFTAVHNETVTSWYSRVVHTFLASTPCSTAKEGRG